MGGNKRKGIWLRERKKKKNTEKKESVTRIYVFFFPPPLATVFLGESEREVRGSKGPQSYSAHGPEAINPSQSHAWP